MDTPTRPSRTARAGGARGIVAGSRTEETEGQLAAGTQVAIKSEAAVRAVLQGTRLDAEVRVPFCGQTGVVHQCDPDDDGDRPASSPQLWFGPCGLPPSQPCGNPRALLFSFFLSGKILQTAAEKAFCMCVAAACCCCPPPLLPMNCHVLWLRRSTTNIGPWGQTMGRGAGDPLG